MLTRRGIGFVRRIQDIRMERMLTFAAAIEAQPGRTVGPRWFGGLEVPLTYTRASRLPLVLF